MERLWPAPSIHLAKVDEEIIVLDLVNDRYDCLIDAGALMSLENSTAVLAVSEAISQELQDTDLATPNPPDVLPAPLVRARRELDLDDRPPRGDVVRAAVILATATLQFRGRSLSELVSFRHRMHSTPVIDELRLSQIVGAVRCARPWIPFEGDCLQRSFLLRAVLAANGVAADWIFGVRTFPFAAHCWLQIGDTVVGDRLHRTSRFVPIMRA